MKSSSTPGWNQSKLSSWSSARSSASSSSVTFTRWQACALPSCSKSIWFCRSSNSTRVISVSPQGHWLFLFPLPSPEADRPQQEPVIFRLLKFGDEVFEVFVLHLPHPDGD